MHEEIGENAMTKALAAHRGRETTYLKIAEQFFWYGIVDDVRDYMKCKNCQRQGKISPVPSAVMKQIDLCNLPEVDGFKHLIVCIDYFLKWSEAKVVQDKNAAIRFSRNL